MKKQYILPLLAISALTGLALTNVNKSEIGIRAFVKEHKNSAGAPAGRTGAPGDQNCTVCHAGAVQNGDAINALTLKDANGNEVTNYIPDQTYDVNFFVDNAAPKKGFQLVALRTSNNTQAGAMTAVTGTNVVTSGGRQYVNHRSTSTSTTTGWNFKWKAPASDVGDIKFYAAANVTNSSNSESGDAIYLSQHTVAYNPTASVEELTTSMNLEAFYASNSNTVNVNFDSRIAASGYMNLVDLSGKSVYSTDFGAIKIGKNKEKILLPAEIKDGIYFVHLFVNNQSSSIKIMIQK